ncbi:MAG: hypothetical protein HQ582_08270 [Planctomycetes bacterium]|nr:hypothetical protein [Planctomycetota bacterium]
MNKANGNGHAAKSRQAVEFLSTLFDSGDYILIRPIESWIDSNGRKRSKVDYEWIVHPLMGMRDNAGVWHPTPDRTAATVKRQAERAEATKANVFFSVCPRVGGGGQYDLAWQIRKVRVLWADVDDCTVEEALKRCETAGLPLPSVVVSSGNGVHLYWLLDEPLLIDDIGTPPPVHTEWIDQGTGKKKRKRQYLIDPKTKEKLSLDAKQNAPDLSPKAQHVQDIVAGIASRIGGDHTQDLSRLLRVPGTLNRKNERNGREPVPCVLLECHADRRYSIDLFKQYADASPSKTDREQLAKVKLPAPRKLSPGRQDRFNELVTACAVTGVGGRSEADFALCCYAIEHGQSQPEVWAEVSNVGKFAEGGERYFQLTWAAAEKQTREKILGQAKRKAGPKGGDSGNEGDDETEVGVKLLADTICETNHFAQDAGQKLYRYAGGVYKRHAENYIRAQVKRLCIEFGAVDEWSTRLASEVVEFIRVDAPELWEKPPVDVLNVQNGLLRINGQKLLPHSPDHLSPVQIPVVYDPSAACPAIEVFVGQVFPPDARGLAWEIPAWLMLASTSMQVAVLLIGEGANGKSTYLAMVIAFLGNANTSGISLHKLEADKFAASRLVGKLANICPDLPSEHLAGTSVFKSLTGGDTLQGEYKFKDSFDFTPFARLVFSANHPPRSEDASHAFFRRWVVIPFDRTIPPEEQTPREELDATLRDQGELSGLLNRALAALDRLKRQRGFSQPESVRDAWLDFHAATDPLGVWLDQSTTTDPTAIAPRSELRIAYNRAAENRGRPAMGEKAFSMALKRLRPEVDDARRTVNGKRVWCYVGIGLTDSLGQGGKGVQDNPFFVPLPIARAENTPNGECSIPQEQRKANPGHPGHLGQDADAAEEAQWTG